MHQEPRKAGIAALIVSAMAAGTALAQPKYDPNYEPPRTPWGDPDLQGKWPGTSMVGVPMTRDPSLGDRNWLTEEEFQERVARSEQQEAFDNADFDLEDAANTPGGAVGGPVSPPPHWLERGEPQYQAGLIVAPADGQYPALTNPAEGGRGRGGFGSDRLASYTDWSDYDRCITRGIAGSILPVIYNNGNQIVQAPGYVAILNEMIHEARIVPLDGRPHASEDIRMWLGDSRGHWDGNTLVVETTNLNDRTAIGVNGGGRMIDPGAMLTERFTRVADDVIVYSMTVDDPKTWVSPWTLELPLRREDDYGMFEYACHEGNYSLFNALSGSRAEERREAEAAAAGGD
jgi:hypothetical protein